MLNFFSKLRRKNRFLWKLGILVSVGILAAVFLAKPVYHVFRDWRVESNATEASEALAAGNFTEARRLAMSVLRLQENRHDMLVVLQRSMEALNDPNAVNVARSLMAHPDATEEDRVRGFQEICAELPLATAARTWMALGKEKANSAAYLEPFARRLVDQDLPMEVASLLLKRNTLDQEPELRLQAVRALLKSGKKQGLVRAQFEISEMMQDEGKWALPAFRLLSTVPAAEFRSAYFPELEAWVKQQDGATTDDQLLAVTQRLQRLPEQKATIAQGAIVAHAETDPAAVARWLIRVGMAEKALELLPEEQSLADDVRFRARAHGLIALKRWPEAGEWLAEPPDSFPLMELHAMHVVCDITPGDPTQRGKAWGLAMQNAGSKANPNDYLELHDRMREAGLDELAREAMVAAARTGRGRLPYWAQVRDLLPWLRAKQEGRAMLDLCSAMAKLEPENPEVVIESLDLACIFGQVTPSKLVEKLRKTNEQNPELSKIPEFTELMSTALLAAGQAEEALASLGGRQDLADASDRVIAVAALAKAMLGDESTSSQLLERVNWKRMLREEKDFFTGLLAKLTAPGTSEPIGNRFDPKILPPSNEPLEAASAPKELPPLTKEFEENAAPMELPPLTKEFEEKAVPKELPPLGESVEAKFKPEAQPSDESEELKK